MSETYPGWEGAPLALHRMGAGRPVILLNGQRIANFREMGRFPPEAIRKVEVLPEGMGQDVTLQSTDPLVYNVNFARGENVQYTVDLGLTTRVFSELEMINGEFRPIPPTPH